VESVARGYPATRNFVEASPRFLSSCAAPISLNASSDLNSKIGLASPLITQSTNPKIQVARRDILTPLALQEFWKFRPARV